ncbi:carbohydrate ABC transporter permease [Plantactinospora soyae]|uniref:Raffinose/stachyose/melibiose transport system permease protein n=1 Tax=Plantactinospora soyae TaxID=1544732 RepID=A0A927MD65_9ACTN|nr:sugar ABC transporter permease [Plantactinospora soyae]MBE1490946.1 raffinose/stachyose/melibiose transport system permease protein [Plantactinospora soyae]
MTVLKEAAASSASRAAPVAPRRRRRSGTAPPWLFAVPAVAVYALVVLYPSLAGVGSAFTDWSGVGEDRSFIGLANFRELLHDEQALGSLRNTLLLTVAIVFVQNGIGLLLALGVHTAIKSRMTLRAVFFAPVVVSPVMVAFLWKYVYNPAPDAGLNALLGSIGLGGLRQDWLGNPDLALWSTAFTVIWQCAGYSMVIFLAGLEGVPKELHEAAMVDGAGSLGRFRYITWPLLAPAVTINVMLSTVGGLTLFSQILAMTGGGPGYATDTLSTVLYKQAFVYGRFGYSTAVALVLALFVAAVSFVQIAYLRSRETTS